MDTKNMIKPADKGLFTPAQKVAYKFKGSFKPSQKVAPTVGEKIEYFFKGDEYNEPCHDCMTVKLLKDLSEGEFFKTTPADHNKNVMVRGEFDRSQGKYFAEGYFNGKETCFNGNKVVFTDFIC